MRKSSARLLSVGVVSITIWLSLGSACAQSTTAATPPQPTATDKAGADKPDVSVKVNVVNALATVRDKHGNLVKNLTKNDFILSADGAPQTIHYFSAETNLPLTLGLLVDTSLSQRNVLDDERTASYKFLDQMLREKDLAFVIHFDREVELLQDLTASRPKLEDALHSLQIAQPRAEEDDPHAPQGPGTGNEQGRHRMNRGGTQLYDAIYLASNELMKNQKERKALIILTDGVDRGSKEDLVTAIAAAQRADTLVYAIYFKSDEEFANHHHGGFGRHIGMGGPGGGGYPGGGHRYPQQERPDGKKVLQQISQETGGRLFEVSKKDTVEAIYSQIQDELRNQYDLGFTPNSSVADAVYHRIQLTTKKKDLTVQTREGYYSNE